jgi:hypothetical protein
MAARVLVPLCLVLTLLATAGKAQSQIFGFDLGRPIAPAGDVDLDGRADFMVGGLSSVHDERVLLYSGRTGLLLRELTPTHPDQDFGAALDGGLDVDGDGTPDQIAAGGGLVGTPPIYAGTVELFSGATGATIHAHLGGEAYQQLGGAVALVEDTNGDAVPDYLVGAAGWDLSGKQNAGSAILYSGASGAPLHQWYGDGEYDEFGTSVAGLGDVDGDAQCDVAVGMREAGLGTPGLGRVRVYSGASGALLYEVVGPAGGTLYGSAVSGSGDANDDGVRDLLVGGWWLDGGSNRGYVDLRNGADGGLIWSMTGVTVEENLGRSIDYVGDLDADGMDDLVLGATQWDGAPFTAPAGPGLLRVVSSGTGRELFSLSGVGLWEQFGRTVSGLGDVNADGVQDLGVSSPSLSGVEESARVFSGTELALTGLPHTLSLSAGGSQSFALAAGVQHAAAFHFLLGTTAGTEPGLPLPGAGVLPLAPDGPGGYLEWTLVHPNQPPLAGTLGILGPGGEAIAGFGLPAGVKPSLAGITLHHAYVVVDPSSLAPVLTSNPVVLSLVP